MDMELTVVVLGVWSVALIQYALVVTTISAKKVRPAFTADGSSVTSVISHFSSSRLLGHQKHEQACRRPSQRRR